MIYGDGITENELDRLFNLVQAKHEAIKIRMAGAELPTSAYLQLIDEREDVFKLLCKLEYARHSDSVKDALQDLFV